jgi:hypothetical protein
MGIFTSIPVPTPYLVQKLLELGPREFLWWDLRVLRVYKGQLALQVRKELLEALEFKERLGQLVLLEQMERRY